MRDLAGNTWDATVHPLLMLPGAVATRTGPNDFTKDIDCLPDHPHESVCAETPAGVLGLNYNLHGQNFAEYQPLVSNSGVRAKAEIVAFAVSGGRAIVRGGAVDELVAGVLLEDPATEALGDLFQTRALRASDLDPDELKYGILGGALIKLAEMLPLNDAKAARKLLERGVEKNAKTLGPEIPRLAGAALDRQAQRAERKLALIRDERFRKLSPR